MTDPVLAGLAILHGIWCAVVFRWYARRLDLRPVFDAIVKSWKSLMADDGHFVREYGRLLLCVFRHVAAVSLAAVFAIAPLLLVVIAVPRSRDNLWFLACVSGGASVLWALISSNRLRRRGPQSQSLGIDDTQFFFLQIARSLPGFLRRVERLESWLLRRSLQQREIIRPVFVTGLARSGTTILLEQLAQANGAATHRYRDFPFVLTPWLWNGFYRVFGRSSPPRERAHRDGIAVNAESPEAFEELIWQTWFPYGSSPPAGCPFGPTSEHPDFERVLRAHIRKMLLIRGGQTYLSKGNYNVARVLYLKRLFPDAQFVLPIRHPVTHVASLMRQHALFCRYAADDDRVAEYLRFAGHFEFGPQRRPVELGDDPQDTCQAWEAGDDLLGYALEWNRVYRFVREHLLQADIASGSIHVIRYEDFCEDPTSELQRLLKETGMQESTAEHTGPTDDIRPSSHTVDPTDAARIWSLTQDVAEEFGYTRDDGLGSVLGDDHS